MTENASLVIPANLLEYIRIIASELPYELVCRVAKAMANPSLDIETACRKSVDLIGIPRFRQSLLALFDAWTTGNPEVGSAAIGAALLSAAYSRHYQEKHESAQLIWTGPDGEIPLRKTDQALMELIGSANEMLTLVSFAVYKYPPLVEAISAAIERGTKVRLILESCAESDGKA